jgi:hypothetical protein
MKWGFSVVFSNQIKNQKENSEKMKIVKFLHFHFTVAQYQTKNPITSACDRVFCFLNNIR